MKLCATLLVATAALTVTAQAADSNKPDWAYAVPDPAIPAPAAAPATSEKLSLPGSKFQFSRLKVQGVADDGSRTSWNRPVRARRRGRRRRR